VKVWYRENAKAPLPTPANIAAMGQEFCELYTPQPLPGKPVQGLISFPISDSMPDSDKILAAAMSLRTSQAPGASGMMVEDVKQWAQEANTAPIPWQLILQLIQHAFTTGIIPTRARSNTLVLIPNRNRDKCVALASLNQYGS